MLCTPDQAELRQQLLERQLALIRQSESIIANYGWQLEGLQRQLQRSSPLNQILNQRQRLDDTLRGMHQVADHLFALERACLEGMQLRLANLSPQAVLQRGYAIVTHHPSGGLVYRANQAKNGEELAVRLADGSLTVQVTHNPLDSRNAELDFRASNGRDSKPTPGGEERDA
jgi:exodeoxyribonuclease VII large subunit